MNTFLELHSQLYYHRFSIRMAATEDTQMNGWPGAVIRNNLLYATEQITVGDGLTLRERINRFPLSDNHPLYKEMSNGFPKGYHIALPDYPCNNNQPVLIRKGEQYSFSLYLIGQFSSLYPFFFKAIRRMCQRGIGHPMRPFVLVDICEKAADGELHLMATDAADVSGKLIFPISLSDFLTIQAHNDETHIRIRYTTPVLLFKKTEKKNKELSYQDKCNGFPSFYQLVRSAAHRLAKLTVLYACPEKDDVALQMMNNIEEFIDYATRLTLISVNLKRVSLKNTLKKEAENKMPLTGYMGEQVYEGWFNRYLPMLRFMEELGVGNEVVYGMGRFEIEVENEK